MSLLIRSVCSALSWGGEAVGLTEEIETDIISPWLSSNECKAKVFIKTEGLQWKSVEFYSRQLKSRGDSDYQFCLSVQPVKTGISCAQFILSYLFYLRAEDAKKIIIIQSEQILLKNPTLGGAVFTDRVLHLIGIPIVTCGLIQN